MSDDSQLHQSPTWLDAVDKRAWTGLVSLMVLLPGRLERPLQEKHSLTLFDYLALSHISEAPQMRMRMSELATLTNGSLSRLSNVVRRFEERGWAVRSPDPSNGRFTTVALTDIGRSVVIAAAPDHLLSVRDFVLDRLSASDRHALARIAKKLTLTDDAGRLPSSVDQRRDS